MIESLSGLREGTHFHLVFSPERVLTGRVFEDLRKYPKLVGGLSREGAALAVDFYEAALDFDERDDLDTPNGVWDLGSAEAAEMAKLAETTYRDVNIALANQFAVHAEEVGVDVYKVIEACNSQPYSHIHRPGISVGGHCIPIYPRLYLSTDTTGGVVGASREVNSKMPALVVSKLVARGLSLKGKNVLILGLAYRSGVKEDAFSGFYPLAEELEKEGATVYVIDPLYSEKELTSRGLRAMRPGARIFAMILHTEHQEFRFLSARDFPGLKIVFDGRDFLSIRDWEGVDFITLGRGKSSTQEFSQ